MEKILEKLNKYLNKAEIDLFTELYNQKIKEYENLTIYEDYKYTNYLYNVIYRLAELNVSACSLYTTLLVKTKVIVYEEITEKYGEDTATMLKALKKIDDVKAKTNNEIDNENYRKIFLALAKDYRVIVIKLAMQEQLILSIVDNNSVFAKDVAQETLDVFAPIAHRLGISSIKTNLENKSLFILNNDDYVLIENMLKQTREERQKCIDSMSNELKVMLDTHNIPYYSIKGRPKSIYSIFNKIVKKNLSFDSLYDLLALRVITETEVNCYEILGYIHAIYKPINGRFKDYIAVPKSNMYQSLHTSVIANDGHTYEIQIRTKEMDEWAESGVASHWRYKEGSKTSNAVIEEKLHFFSEFVNDNKDVQDEEYIENLKKEVFESSIYVMSPKGKVVELPIGSCPIDFAYRIHSNVGHSCTGALVNGLMVPLNTELHTGDIVEIKTSKIHTEPSEGWMQFVKTSAAKNAIRKYLQKKQKENNKDIMIASGKSLLDEQIREQQLNDKTLEETLNDVPFLQQFGVTKLEELYFAIANRTVNVNNICDKIKSRKFKELKPTFEFKKRTIKKSSNCGVIVNGIDNIKVELSLCCHPIPGDEIVGYITRGRGVKVHCKDCPTLATLDNRLIDVEWDMEVSDNVLHQANLIVRASDRSNLLLEIMNILSTLKITVLELNAISHKESLNASVQLSIMVKDSSHLNSIMNSLRNLKGVFEVFRVENA